MTTLSCLVYFDEAYQQNEVQVQSFIYSRYMNKYYIITQPLVGFENRH